MRVYFEPRIFRFRFIKVDKKSSSSSLLTFIDNKLFNDIVIVINIFPIEIRYCARRWNNSLSSVLIFGAIKPFRFCVSFKQIQNIQQPQFTTSVRILNTFFLKIDFK